MTKAHVRLRRLHFAQWLTGRGVSKALLVTTVLLAVGSMALHIVAAIRLPQQRLTEIGCAVSWACVLSWVLVARRWERMYFHVRDELERLARGFDNFTSS